MHAPFATTDTPSKTDAGPGKEPEAIADEIWTAYYDSMGQGGSFSPVDAIAAAIRAARQEARAAGYRQGRCDLREEAEAAIWAIVGMLDEPDLVNPERGPVDHTEALKVLEDAALAVHRLPDDRRR